LYCYEALLYMGGNQRTDIPSLFYPPLSLSVYPLARFLIGLTVCVPEALCAVFCVGESWSES